MARPLSIKVHESTALSISCPSEHRIEFWTLAHTILPDRLNDRFPSFDEYRIPHRCQTKYREQCPTSYYLHPAKGRNITNAKIGAGIQGIDYVHDEMAGCATQYDACNRPSPGRSAIIEMP